MYEYEKNTFAKMSTMKVAGLPVGKWKVPVVSTDLMDSMRTSSFYDGQTVLVEKGHAIFHTEEAYEAFLKTQNLGLFGQVFETSDWPLDAEWKITYTVRSWPTASECHAIFFNDAASAVEWLSDMREWASLEDNHFDVVQVEEWDWGPTSVKMSRLKEAA